MSTTTKNYTPPTGINLDEVRRLGYEIPELTPEEKAELWKAARVLKLPRSLLAAEMGLTRTELNFLIVAIEEERQRRKNHEQP